MIKAKQQEQTQHASRKREHSLADQFHPPFHSFSSCGYGRNDNRTGKSIT